MSTSVRVGSRSSNNEMWETMGVGTPPTLTTTHKFSGYHPVIPKRYVPQWQTDMKNRKLTIDLCKSDGIGTWIGHQSYFINNRERISITRYPVEAHVVGYSRHLQPNTSHFSKYNSALFWG